MAVQTTDKEPKRVGITELSSAEARDFFLKGESYCGFELPTYFKFDTVLAKVSKILAGKNLRTLYDSVLRPRDFDDVNHTVLSNKDGKLAWRPFQLINPAIYVELVHLITKEENWNHILRKLEVYSRKHKIRCLSHPVTSLGENSDKAEQVSQWWEEVEQEAIYLSLEYEYVAETDISDCYGSLYTHSVAWALNRRSYTKKKENRNDLSLLGNAIDSCLQDMSFGQTNGIPQGSVLMDFVAEIVLAYADFILGAKIRKSKITDYRILRYRDDYRIFVNSVRDGEEILKLVSETMHFLGMKLHAGKTSLTGNVIKKSIKEDRLDWTKRKQAISDLQKHLLLIHDLASDHPNSGSIPKALNAFHSRIANRKGTVRSPLQMIAIAADIAFHNPKAHAICVAILGDLIGKLDSDSQQDEIIGKLQKRFDKVPNNGHLQIWLQRLTIKRDSEIEYTEPLCRLVKGEDVQIWNTSWIGSKQLVAALNSKKIVNGNVLRRIKPNIPPAEVALYPPKSL